MQTIRQQHTHDWMMLATELLTCPKIDPWILKLIASVLANRHVHLAIKLCKQYLINFIFLYIVNIKHLFYHEDQLALRVPPMTREDPNSFSS